MVDFNAGAAIVASELGLEKEFASAARRGDAIHQHMLDTAISLGGDAPFTTGAGSALQYTQSYPALGNHAQHKANADAKAAASGMRSMLVFNIINSAGGGGEGGGEGGGGESAHGTIETQHGAPIDPISRSAPGDTSPVPGSAPEIPSLPDTFQLNLNPAIPEWAPPDPTHFIL